VTRGVHLGFDERRNQRLLAWAIVVVFVLGLLAFIAKGADQPADPYLKPAASAAAAVGTTPLTTVPIVTVPLKRTAVPGFGEVTFRVATGPQLYALLACTSQQQAQGLMKRTDLAGHVGMLFVFKADTNETFYMRNTPMPLSIAWFDATGRFVSATDMVPCADRPDCPTYAAARAYRYALEVPRGGLSSLGIGPGSTITVGAGC
jgi:uncharacterized membrane protein (UPF0127 family)